MFDANADHIPLGQRFFAEVHGVNSQLEEAGIARGDIVLCEHVEKSSDRIVRSLLTKIWVSMAAEPVTYRYEPIHKDWSWMVYSGRPDGRGFIDEAWKAKALMFLNGEWHK
ncbi:hypothetical protein ACNO5E_04775 [Vibrio parahaemolyticus]